MLEFIFAFYTILNNQCQSFPYRWPLLGSRIVFELWSDVEGGNAHVKILMNGKDYTMKTKPCLLVGKEGM